MIRILFSIGLVSLMLGQSMAADLTTIEKRAVQTVQALIKKAGKEFQSGNYEASGESIQKAIRQIQVAVKAGSPELFDELEPAMKRISQAHTMLELEGVELPAFRKPKRPEAKAEMGEDKSKK